MEFISNTQNQIYLLILISGFLSVFCLVLALPGSVGRRVLGLWRQQYDANDALLQDANLIEHSVKDILTMAAFAAVVSAFVVQILVGNIIVTVFIAGICLASPKFVIEYLRDKRMAEFEEALPLALDQIASSARAGLTLTQCLEEAAISAPKPVNQELRRIVNDVRLGTDMGVAIEELRIRLNSRGFNLVATALKVNRDRGGNLPEALNTMSAALKEIWRLEEKIFTASSEGRKAVKVISVMPVIILAMVLTMQPDMVDQITGTVPGMVILGVSVVMYAVGMKWLLSILKVEV